MPKHDRIQSEDLRQLVAEGYALMRHGNGTDAVHKFCDSLARLVQIKPEYLERRVQMRFREFPAVLAWPMLGANLKADSVAAGKLEFDFVRERFAVSEAMTYYEFMVATALSLGA